MHLEQVGVGRHEQVLYWSVQTEGAMSTTSREEIPIPSTFPQGGDVDGKRVVITGAGRGLGRLLAHAFSQGGARVTLVARTERSEEHTSELQSLMRISYAVFCLKQTNKKT